MAGVRAAGAGRSPGVGGNHVTGSPSQPPPPQPPTPHLTTPQAPPAQRPPRVLDLGGGVLRVLAGNPGPMTLEGTNTYLLSPPGGTEVLVVDPGPDDPDHLAAVQAVAADAGLVITGVACTHAHPDHAAGALTLAERAGARLLPPLEEGDHPGPGGLALSVLATPGHSADSVCLLMDERGLLLTGDTVLGRGTTVVAWPDGRLEDYLASLERLARLAPGLTGLLPGHGPVLADPAGVIRAYLDHRAVRLEEVRRALAGGARSVAEVLDAVYADIPDTVRPAAGLSVRAQMEYLGWPV